MSALPGSGPGALRCIDARQRGDVTKTAEVWRLDGEGFNDSLSTVAVHEGLVFAADGPGFLHCIDAKSGERLWSHDHLSNIWGSALVADGKVYVQTGEGVVHVFQAGREKKLLAKNDTLPEVAHTLIPDPAWSPRSERVALTRVFVITDRMRQPPA